MKNYKILRICPARPYLDLFTDFYEINKLDELSYEGALQRYQEQGFLIPGSWSLCMRKLGNESTDVVPGFLLLQRHWAEEKGVKIDYDTRDWSTSVLFAQISVVKPDVIFFYAGGFRTLSPNIRKQLKRIFPFLEIITGWWGDVLAHNQYSIFGDLDVMFCGNTRYRDYMISAGIRAYANGSCFDHIVGKRIEQDEEVQPVFDFIFAGSSGYGFDDHKERYLDLVKIMENTNLRTWCYEREQPKRSAKRKFRDRMLKILCSVDVGYLQTLRKHAPEDGLISRLVDDALAIQQDSLYPTGYFFGDRKPIRELFPSRCFPPVFGSEYYELLKRAKIVFNRHRDERADYGNLRMFEVTGVGTCLLTDRGNEAAEFFVPDEEIVTYSSIDECIEKVHYLLDNESVRKEIARKGQARTLRDHTVINRCQQIDDILQKTL